MFREVEPLTFLEVVSTYGFWKIMSIVWTIPLIVFIGYVIKCKLSNKII